MMTEPERESRTGRLESAKRIRERAATVRPGHHSPNEFEHDWPAELIGNEHAMRLNVGAIADALIVIAEQGEEVAGISGRQLETERELGRRQGIDEERARWIGSATAELVTRALALAQAVKRRPPSIQNEVAALVDAARKYDDVTKPTEERADEST